MKRRQDTPADSANDAILNWKTYRCVMFETRLMHVVTFLTSSSILVFLAAVVSTDWAYIDFPAPSPPTPASALPTTATRVRVHLGIWGEWRHLYNATDETTMWIRHFPEPPQGIPRLSNNQLPHYYRAQAVFSAISILLMVPVNLLACYTFNAYRYTYKRLVACIHMLIAFCMVVNIEVLAHSMSQWTSVHDQQTQAGAADDASGGATDYSTGRSYGWATYLVWYVFGCHVVAAVIFVVGGRKRKGSFAATGQHEFEDRPVIIGR